MREQYRDSSRLRARAALHARFSTNLYSWYRWLFDHYALPALATVLEVGCGPGDLWERNRDRIAATWRVLVTDLSPGMVGEARRALGDLSGFSFAAADARALPVPDASFHAVIANQMLQHTPALESALAELRRVLRPHGTLYAGLSGRDHMREVTDLVQSFDSSLGAAPSERDVLTLEDAEDYLKRTFTEVEVDRFDDALVVTEAAPLVDYVYSMAPPRTPRPEQRKAFTDFIARRLARDGTVRITKVTGICVAEAVVPPREP